MATNYYNEFIQKLKEIFMMDHAELDFGIYRIMNQKRDEILKFLDRDLLPQVKDILSASESVDTSANLAKGNSAEELQSEVFSHLSTFFSRYYDGGDFISQRRYKDNAYAIPYQGEEVKLYWANADQYYIKTSEYFRDYSFILPTSRKKVHFVLKDADTEQNNNKAADKMERRFAIYVPQNEDEKIFSVNKEGDLEIYFTYSLMAKKTKQADLCQQAYQVIREQILEDFNELLSVKCPTKAEPNRTLLEKHLSDYTAKNSFDYFIHKDLGGFLSRELDFYLKNEVLHIDDLNMQHIESQLLIVKAIKQVGMKIIQMLAQLENFQKQLWLKKKFVVQCDYCITLDRIPEKYYAEIIVNDGQRKEWVELFAIDKIKGNLTTEGYSEPLTIEFLQQNPFLVLDTAFFSTRFKHRLLAEFDNIDESCDGLLINSDNYQALRLLEDKYKYNIDYCYIDPPYNTDSTPIIYKNGYKDSCWCSLMENRLNEAKRLLVDGCVLTVAIDNEELYCLGGLLDGIMGKENRIAVVTVQHNPKGRNQAEFFSENVEYMLEYSTNKWKSEFNDVAISENVKSTFGDKDEHGDFRWENFVRARNNRKKEDRPENWYPIYVSKDLKTITYKKDENFFEVWPIVSSGDFTWKKKYSTFIELCNKNYFSASREGDLIQIYHKYYENEVLKNLWIDKKYQSEFNGTNLLKNMFGVSNIFSYPKSLYTVLDSIKISCQKNGIVLDFFGGSGTTAHAIIESNREGANRKYILVEMGEYFGKVTKSRVEKSIYSRSWKKGIPSIGDGISHCFKYMRLEQYEDTLNNLALQDTSTLAFKEGGTFHESYMLNYMLDAETRDSLLNMKWFVNPFAMTLKTTKDNELVDTQVDMVETFNYLIGLNVESMAWFKEDNICVVQGRTHREQLNTLVIWRNCEVIDNPALNTFFEKMDFRTKDSEFDVIYVNGDNTLPNIKRDDEHWKVVLIEEEFTKRMFEEI